MQPEQQQRIMGYFIEEAKDHLNTIERGLLHLQSTIDDPEMVNEMFRAAHSVKGGAAMLGLQGIQHVSHRLEDFFKVLKDSEVRVDQKMESAFLQVFDTLKEFVDQLQAPFGVTEEETQKVLAGVEPVFKELEQQLSGAAGAPRTSVPMEYRPDIALSPDPSLMQTFRESVPTSLREMLTLFKQPESDAVSRRQLQEICDRLHSLGVTHQLPTWCHLIESAQRAIVAPENTYRTLAPVIIKDIKQAQELILAGRAAEVCPGPQLLALVPITAARPTLEPDFGDLFVVADPASQLTQAASDDLLFDTSDFDFEAANLGAADSAESSRLSSGSTPDLDASALELDPVFSEAALTAATEYDGDGPEVGIEELNTLADLFEGEMPDLGATWQEEELLGEIADGETFNPHSLAELEDTNDFSDLLFAETPTNPSGNQTSSEDELNNLFGDVLDDVSESNGLNPPGTFGDAFDLSGMAASEASPSSSSALNSGLDLDLDLELEMDADADLSDLLAIPGDAGTEADSGNSAWDALEDSFDALGFSDLDASNDTGFNAEPALSLNSGVAAERAALIRMEAPFDEMGDLFEGADIEELSLSDELSLSEQSLSDQPMDLLRVGDEQSGIVADPWAEDINLSTEDLLSTEDFSAGDLFVDDLLTDDLLTDESATVIQPWSSETDAALPVDVDAPDWGSPDLDISALDMSALSELTSDDDALDFGDFNDLMDSELESDLNVGSEEIELLVDSIPEQSFDDFFGQEAAPEVQNAPQLRDTAEAAVVAGEVPDPWGDSFDELGLDWSPTDANNPEPAALTGLNVGELNVADAPLDSIDLSDFSGLEQGEAADPSDPDAFDLDALDLDAFDWEATAEVATSAPEAMPLNAPAAKLSDDPWDLDFPSTSELAPAEQSVVGEIDGIADVGDFLGIEDSLGDLGGEMSFTDVPESVAAFDELTFDTFDETFDELEGLENSVVTDAPVPAQNDVSPLDTPLNFGTEDLFDDALGSSEDDLFDDALGSSEDDLFGEPPLSTHDLENSVVSGDSLDFGDDNLFSESLGSLEDSIVGNSPFASNAALGEHGDTPEDNLFAEQDDLFGEQSLLENTTDSLTNDTNLFSESSSTATDDLFGTAAEDLFGSVDEEEDLFGAVPEEGGLFGAAVDDLLGSTTEEEDLFGAATLEDDSLEDDLFGSATPGDDLFGLAVTTDDLFGEQSGLDQALTNEQDLFGATGDEDSLFDESLLSRDAEELSLEFGDEAFGNALDADLFGSADNDFGAASDRGEDLRDEEVDESLDDLFDLSPTPAGAAVDESTSLHGFSDDDFGDLGQLLGETDDSYDSSVKSITGFDDLDGDSDPVDLDEFLSINAEVAEPEDDFADLGDLLNGELDDNSGEATPGLDDFDSLLADSDSDAGDDLNLFGLGGVMAAAAGGAIAASFARQSAETRSAAEEDFSDLDALLGEAPENDAFDLTTGSDPAPDLTSGMDDGFDELDDLLRDAEERMGGGGPMVKAGRSLPATPTRRAPRPGRGLGDQTMRVPVKHLDNLSNLVGELVVNRNSLEQDQERLRQSLDNLLYQVQQLSDVGQRMQDLYERSLLESSLLASRQNHRAISFGGQPEPVVNAADSQADVEYDPLEMDRFTGFHSLSQEMIELIVRVRESSSDIEFIVDETDQVTRMFRQVTTQLQEGLTRSRMVPFAQTADRLPRAVRDISMKVGKQAELIIEGRETLIDKMILEHLYDPMTHLVNNALTHGIESPEVRRAAGKSAMGRITVRAFHQGNQTIISVSDDGAGIDVDRVKAKAIEKGLLTPAEVQQMTRLDVYDLLFHAGFTTKDQADDFSGRGVGMDVVRTSLSEIRGVINTDSNVGKGTTFTIRLPLTLSISKALCCISDRARIAFPMDGVEDMLDLPKERMQTNAEGQPCIAWRDSLLPLHPLTDLLGYNRHLSRGNVYGGAQEDDIISVVVLRSAGNYLALQVDNVLGEQEIVIKQLEGPVPKPIGVAGATVLGDGRIMPIADVLELIDLSMGRIRRDSSGALWDQGGAGMLTEPTVIKTEPTVLIVDDSITVRELLSMTFNKVGYRVEQARDGQEAWEKLRSGLPCDIVFCDIEMPRMDGLELLSRIQKDPVLNAVPIAMLTSRGADRHRQMAASLGASGYFTKPYLEEALLDAAQRMLKGEVLISNPGNA